MIMPSIAEQVLGASFPASPWTYDEHAVILYALGLGCSAEHAQWTYEQHEDFGPLPSFAVLAQYQAEGQSEVVQVLQTLLPNYSPVQATKPCVSLLTGQGSASEFAAEVSKLVC